MTKIDFLAMVEARAADLGNSMANLTRAKRALQLAIVIAAVDGKFDLDQIKGKARDALHKALGTAKVKADADHKRLVNTIDQCISQANRVAKGWDKLSAQMQASVRRGATPISGALAKLRELDKQPAETSDGDAGNEPDGDDDDQHPDDGQLPVAARMALELTAFVREVPFAEWGDATFEAMAELYKAIGEATAPADEQRKAA